MGQQAHEYSIPVPGVHPSPPSTAVPELEPVDEPELDDPELDAALPASLPDEEVDPEPELEPTPELEPPELEVVLEPLEDTVGLPVPLEELAWPPEDSPEPLLLDAMPEEPLGGSSLDEASVEAPVSPKPDEDGEPHAAARRVPTSPIERGRAFMWCSQFICGQEMDRSIRSPIRRCRSGCV